jgi:hypothetical protein
MSTGVVEMRFNITGFLTEIRDVAPGMGRLVLRVDTESWAPFQGMGGQYRPSPNLEIMIQDGVPVPGCRQTVTVEGRISAAEFEREGRNRGDVFKMPRMLLFAERVMSTAAAEPQAAKRGA